MTDSIDIAGVPDTVDMLDAIAGRTADVSPVAETIYLAFLDIERRRFDAEGPGWAELADSTLQEKTRKGQPATILEATGKLRASLTEAGAPGAVFDPFFSAGATALVMGTDLKPDKPGRGWEDTALGWFHQTGHPGYRPSPMPARPVIDDDAEIALDASAQLTEWLMYGTVSTLL